MDELELEFTLDPRLQADTINLGKFPLCQLLLMNDSHYPWFILVPRRAGATELYHLSVEDQQQFMRESSFLGEHLSDLFQARKMNVAMLGNVVSQLHIHHVVRFETDAAWPGPIWGKVAVTPYTPQEIETLRSRMKTLLDKSETFEFAN